MRIRIIKRLKSNKLFVIAMVIAVSTIVLPDPSDIRAYLLMASIFFIFLSARFDEGMEATKGG